MGAVGLGDRDWEVKGRKGGDGGGGGTCVIILCERVSSSKYKAKLIYSFKKSVKFDQIDIQEANSYFIHTRNVQNIPLLQ